MIKHGEKMKVNILLFASLKEQVGTSCVHAEIPESSTVSDLLDVLYTIHPNLKRFSQNMIVSINQEYVSCTQHISPADEIALFPPVSGG